MKKTYSSLDCLDALRKTEVLLDPIREYAYTVGSHTMYDDILEILCLVSQVAGDIIDKGKDYDKTC